LAEQIEVLIKSYQETLMKQFKEENEKLREELSSKLEAEVTKFQETKDKLHKDTAIETVSVSHSMESVCE
jgi:polyhydroxyalkanoate synthesis regulator protein